MKPEKKEECSRKWSLSEKQHRFFFHLQSICNAKYLRRLEFCSDFAGRGCGCFHDESMTCANL